MCYPALIEIKIPNCRKNIKIRTTVEPAMSSHLCDTGKVAFQHRVAVHKMFICMQNAILGDGKVPVASHRRLPPNKSGCS